MVVTDVAMAATAVATTARGLLMPTLRLRLMLSPATATADTDAATAAMVDATDTARGRLSPATAMAVMDAATEAMAATGATTARGRLRLSPATDTDAAMVVTDAAMAATAVATDTDAA